MGFPLTERVSKAASMVWELRDFFRYVAQQISTDNAVSDYSVNWQLGQFNGIPVYDREFRLVYENMFAERAVGGRYSYYPWITNGDWGKFDFDNELKFQKRLGGLEEMLAGEGDNVIELGCGGGKFLKHLAGLNQKNFHYGFDRSIGLPLNNNVVLPGEVGSNFRIENGDWRKVNLPDGIARAIISHEGVAHWGGNLDQMFDIAGEMSRLASGEGCTARLFSSDIGQLFQMAYALSIYNWQVFAAKKWEINTIVSFYGGKRLSID